MLLGFVKPIKLYALSLARNRLSFKATIGLTNCCRKTVVRHFEYFKTVRRPLLQLTLNLYDGSCILVLFSKLEQRSLKVIPPKYN